MDTQDPFSAIIPVPTAARPLLGLTVLVIEDSRFACEAMLLLCLRSGARIRRADCMRSARRHLQVYRPSVVIVDLGLPDGNGIDLITELTQVQPRVGIVLGTSGDSHRRGDVLAARADGFMEKPITSLALFQQIILAALPPERQLAGPRVLTEEEIRPDPLAFQDDMSHIADVLEDPPNEHALDYVTQFISGIARSASDERLELAALALAEKRALGQSAASETAILAGIVQQRLTQKLAI